MTSLPHDVAYTRDSCSITGQLAALGLLPPGWDRRQSGDAGTAIELSNATADSTAPSRPQRPRLVHWQRTKDPMLQAWPSESGRQLEAWCPHCRTYHYHGRHGSIERCGDDCSCELHTTRSYRAPCTCPPGAGDGHRSAHCQPGSPFKATGYVVREVRP